MVDKPVLFVAFARPEYAQQSFDAIKKAQPRKLYFYSNKARAEKPEEVKRNEEVRSLVKQVDWDCELKTWFRDEYVDVFTSLWGAIDWIFDNEEEAIIVEEDVVTCPAFYEFTSTLLDKYRDNKQVWIISGDNATPQYNPKGYGYFPTRFADIFGWASWADRWHSLDREMRNWPRFRISKEFHDYYGSWLQRKLQRFYFDQVYRMKPSYNPWDFIFNYNMALNRGYSLMPYTNLVASIGVVGVNHKIAMDTPLSTIKIDKDYFPFEMAEPQKIEPTSFDRKYFINFRLKRLIKRKLYKLFGV